MVIKFLLLSSSFFIHLFSIQLISLPIFSTFFANSSPEAFLSRNLKNRNMMRELQYFKFKMWKGITVYFYHDHMILNFKKSSNTQQKILKAIQNIFTLQWENPFQCRKMICLFNVISALLFLYSLDLFVNFSLIHIFFNWDKYR